MGADRRRSLRAFMVGCSAAHRIDRQTGTRGRAECNANGGVVGRKSETRFQIEADSEGGINAISGISGRISLRCGTSDFRPVRRTTNPGDAPGFYRPAAAITRKISTRPELRASVAPVR